HSELLQKQRLASPKSVHVRSSGHASSKGSPGPQRATHWASLGAPQTVPPTHSSPPSLQLAPTFGSSTHSPSPPAAPGAISQPVSPPSPLGGGSGMMQTPYLYSCPGSQGS